MDQNETLSHFVDRLNIILVSRETVEGDPKGNVPNSDPWSFERCVIKFHDRELIVEHTYGFPDSDVPPLEEVLDDAAADAVCVGDNPTLEEWIESFHGIAADDPECTLRPSDWVAHKSRARALKEFLGESEYNNLLYRVERL